MNNIKHASEAQPGDISQYIPGQAEGAIPNDSVIIKVNSESNDATPNGTAGIVVASHNVAGMVDKFPEVKYFYFVEWETLPGLAVGVVDKKLKTKENP